MKHIVIIGNGISGITAARNIRKLSDNKITVISAETDHFFSRTALMYIYMGHMRYKDTKPYEDFFWKKNRIDLVRAYVSKVDFDAKTLHLDSGSTISYDSLILATGSKPNKFGWPGQDLPGVQGLYSYQDLELLEKNTKDIQRAVIVGGGLIGIELAEMLLSRKIPVTFLVREPSFWKNVLPAEESAMINRHIKEHHIDLRLGTELKEVLADKNGRSRAVITNTGEEIACQMIGLTAGVSPNIDFLKDSKVELGRGIKVNEFLETNIENVYALGDCAEFKSTIGERRPIEQVWYTGKLMGEVVAKNICGNKTAYTPGNWYNSAKFLDIEYQTYGWVWAQPKDNEENFYWEDKSGKKSFRARFDKSSKAILGVNVFGIRHRHKVWDKWISEKRTITECLANLNECNFDPEFFQKHEQDIVDAWNEKLSNKKVTLKSNKGLLSKIFG
ncbi:MAG: NAD(P)/FAD-dependent oxidoreductase [Bacteroidia bacterium]|nr:NAD(P)/FAD-dependent oxidoreductase [Bacteroidia bacterium]NNC86546.1 NAD(P)/FAD-dependent oxidoreductase [Bacteroidia bacterium]NNM16791.1 NAD(P)/FAD-dependent oxidoreductase [Bacteroidia bacterium]